MQSWFRSLPLVASLVGVAGREAQAVRGGEQQRGAVVGAAVRVTPLAERSTSTSAGPFAPLTDTTAASATLPAGTHTLTPVTVLPSKVTFKIAADVDSAYAAFEAGETVTVRLTATLVDVLLSGRRVALHARVGGERFCLSLVLHHARRIAHRHHHRRSRREDFDGGRDARQVERDDLGSPGSGARESVHPRAGHRVGAEIGREHFRGIARSPSGAGRRDCREARPIDERPRREPPAAHRYFRSHQGRRRPPGRAGDQVRNEQ